jgi:hypothetical protein
MKSSTQDYVFCNKKFKNNIRQEHTRKLRLFLDNLKTRPVFGRDQAGQFG